MQPFGAMASCIARPDTTSRLRTVQDCCDCQPRCWPLFVLVFCCFAVDWSHFYTGWCDCIKYNSIPDLK